MSTQEQGPRVNWRAPVGLDSRRRQGTCANGPLPEKVDAQLGTGLIPGEAEILQLSADAPQRLPDASPALALAQARAVERLGHRIALHPTVASHAAFVGQCLDACLVGGGLTRLVVDRVLSGLEDPRPLLRRLRLWLSTDSSKRVVIVEDHAQCIHRFGATPRELVHAAGFTTEVDSLTEGHTVLHVRFDASARRDYLSTRGLAAPGDRLMLTLEHADARVTGGIGTYVRTLERLLYPRPLVLFVGDKGLPTEGRNAWLRDRGWLSPELLGSGPGPLSDQTLEAALHAVFLYHEVRLIEYQECSGHFAFVAQAKQVGLLPPEVETRVVCHGPEEYLERNERRFFIPENTEVNLREKACVELSDSCIFPTHFMRTLVEDEFGMHPRGAVLQHRLPFDSARPLGEQLSTEPAVDTLVFFGAPSRKKGFPDFCNAVRTLWTEPEWADVRAVFRRVVVIGPESVADGTNWPEDVVVAQLVCDHTSAMRELAALVGRGLVVLPYRGDNHPYSVLEVIDCGHVPLLCRSGGIPELVPEGFHEFILHDPGPQGILHAIARRARQGALWNAEQSRALHSAVFREQAAINRAYASLSCVPVASVPSPPAAPALVLWVHADQPATPSEMAGWVREQSLQPTSVWLPYAQAEREIATCLATALGGDYSVHLVEVSQNGRLSEGIVKVASGLAEATLVSLGPKHTPSRRLSASLVAGLACDSSADVVTPWIDAGTERADARLRPLGEGVIASITSNTLGSLTFAARSASLKQWLKGGGREVVATHALTLLGSFVEGGLRIAGYPEVLAWGPVPAPARTFSEQLERGLGRASLPRHESRALERLVAEGARASRAARRNALARTFRLSLRDLLADEPRGIAVHGAGDNGLILAELLEELGLPVVALTDRFPDRRRLETHSGLGVTSLSDALATGIRAFLISSSQHEEAMRQDIETAARAAGVRVTLYLPHSGRSELELP